jgi:hypothetical protein
MFTSIEQISNWLEFHFQSETTNKACNQFGSQKYYKTLISTEFIICYHQKGLRHSQVELKLVI